MKKLVVMSSLAVAACGQEASDYRAALPERDVVEVALPEAGSAPNGLTGESLRGLVGQAADFYTHTYYAAQHVNGFAKNVVESIQEVASHPPTQLDAQVAVWGPFSGDGEPIEYVLTIEDLGDHLNWVAQLRHKSAVDFVTMAAGSFAPEEAGGRGWFSVDFEAIRSVNPAEGKNGQISYAFERSGGDLRVSAWAQQGSEEAAYTYGKGEDGRGYVMFAIPENLDGGGELGFVDTGARERMVILSRWGAEGIGRADVLVTDGDVSGHTISATQCWNGVYAATFEQVGVDGQVRHTEGDDSSCLAADGAEELPEPADIENPYQTE